MKTILLIAALFSSALMAQNVALPNGLYAVEDGQAKGSNLTIRQHEGKDVVIDTKNFVPLAIKGKPVANRYANGSGLMIQLAPEEAKRLKDLTQTHMNRQIAVVVGDKVLSTPTVRSVITDGNVRVTPCEEESCATLLRELSK